MQFKNNSKVTGRFALPNGPVVTRVTKGKISDRTPPSGIAAFCRLVFLVTSVRPTRYGGSVWESNVVPDGISSTYEERGRAKSRIKNTEELLLFPDLFPRFRKRVEISIVGNKPTHLR